ncbi:MAG TPA: hypothetical protein VG273_09760 [Bryobacteraceae bacterium]|jgi:hypothetical protein|nr:hypothetical protein [Bryobacteraceae bacterium]
MSIGRAALLAASIAAACAAQTLDFHAAERQIVRLPPSAFPMLPAAIVHELQQRGCTIPQDAFSKKPVNVISGEFVRHGQKDWAVLCSVNGSSSILVFWNGSAKNPAALNPAEDINYLQGLGGEKIGFSRGIAVAGVGFIDEHYRAYGGPKPPPLDHDGIDDAFLEKGSSVQYFYAGKWLQLTGSD